jgi:hypothetical protein
VTSFRVLMVYLAKRVEWPDPISRYCAGLFHAIKLTRDAASSAVNHALFQKGRSESLFSGA